MAKRGKTRPAFSIGQYRKLIRGTRRWKNEATGNPQWRYTRELLHDYVLLLANSGIRVGEANNLRETDLVEIKDDNGRPLYGFNVNGKTGRRLVVLRANARSYVERVLARNREWEDRWAVAEANDAKAHNRKTTKHGGWLFRMADGNKIITLIDQFNEVLRREGLSHNTDGEKYSLYSLRHFYAVQMLRRGQVNVFDIARNMGTSVQIIEDYYGKDATSLALATRLGD